MECMRKRELWKNFAFVIVMYNKTQNSKSNIIFFKFSTLYKKIASNTLSQILSKIITALISIVLIGILTKYLPIELYGSYNKVYNYLWIFAFLADLGLYTIAVREISLWKETKEKIVGNILTLRTVLGLCIWVLACIIALLLPWYHDTLTFLAIMIVGGFTLVSLINSSLLALMQSQMKIEFSLVSLVAWKVINIFLIALFLMVIFTDVSQIPQAFVSVFFAGFVGVSLNTYLNYRYARWICSISYLWDYSYIKYLFRISLPYGIALFLSVVYFKVDIVLLSLLESSDKGDVSIALYGLPMKIVEVLMVLGWFYLNSLLPTLTKKYKQKKYQDISHILWISLKILFSFGILIFTLGNILAVEIISVIATPEYLNAGMYTFTSLDAFRIVLWVLVFHFLALAFIYMFIASEKQSFLLKVNIFVTIFNIVWNIYLIPEYSFVWAAIVTLLSQVLLMSICAYVFLKNETIPLKYLLWLLKSCGIWAWLYVSISYIKSLVDVPDFISILVFWILFLLCYIWLEFLASRKLIQENANLYL